MREVCDEGNAGTKDGRYYFDLIKRPSTPSYIRPFDELVISTRNVAVDFRLHSLRNAERPRSLDGHLARRLKGGGGGGELAGNRGRKGPAHRR